MISEEGFLSDFFPEQFRSRGVEILMCPVVCTPVCICVHGCVFVCLCDHVCSLIRCLPTAVLLCLSV